MNGDYTKDEFGIFLMPMTEQKGDFFLDKYTNVLYIFDGNEWLKIVPTSVALKKSWECSTM